MNLGAEPVQAVQVFNAVTSPSRNRPVEPNSAAVRADTSRATDTFRYGVETGWCQMRKAFGIIWKPILFVFVMRREEIEAEGGHRTGMA